MANYCGECALWQGSSDSNRYGERWCGYSRRYEKADQNTYGCRGFVYAQRAVLTKVCDILNLPKARLFDCFDRVKEAYIVPQHMDLLTQYCTVGPALAARLDADAARETVARTLYNRYICPAAAVTEAGEYGQAVHIYGEMVKTLKERYC